MKLPRLRRDGKGYIWDGDDRLGFADRPSLPREVRIAIAEMAAEHAPKGASPAQQRLLEEWVPVSSPLIDALVADQFDVQSAIEQGLTADFSDADWALLRDPSLHPRLVGARYPLAVGELSTLTRATERQIRHWADTGLVPTYRISGQRRFMSGGFIRALALMRMPQSRRTPIVTALATAAQVNEQGGRFVGYVFDVLVTLARRQKDASYAKQVLDAAHEVVTLMRPIYGDESEPSPRAAHSNGRHSKGAAPRRSTSGTGSGKVAMTAKQKLVVSKRSTRASGNVQAKQPVRQPMASLTRRSRT